MRDACRVEPGTKANLADRPTDDRLGIDKGDGAGGAGGAHRPPERAARTALRRERTGRCCSCCRGSTRPGKDGTIRRVFTGLNPQGCDVESFKAPTPTEAAHDFLWRIHHALPARGDIGIFNRSHYEDVVAARGRRRDRRRAAQAALRAHQRVRADAARRGHDDREDLPARRQGRAARPAAGAARRSGEALEVRARPTSQTRAKWDEYMQLYDAAITRDVDRSGRRGTSCPPTTSGCRASRRRRILVDTLEALDPKIPAPKADLDGIVIESRAIAFGAMPTPEQVKAVAEAYVAASNANDKAAVLAQFAPDAVWFDPVGPAAARRRRGDRRVLRPDPRDGRSRRDEAARRHRVRARGRDGPRDPRHDGRTPGWSWTASRRSRSNDDGKIAGMKAYWDMTRARTRGA